VCTYRLSYLGGWGRKITWVHVWGQHGQQSKKEPDKLKTPTIPALKLLPSQLCENLHWFFWHFPFCFLPRRIFTLDTSGSFSSPKHRIFHVKLFSRPACLLALAPLSSWTPRHLFLFYVSTPCHHEPLKVKDHILPVFTTSRKSGIWRNLGRFVEWLH
jgi:hypothetical protein